ncbi:MAG: tRNA 2-thiocytidine biosynthesis protein TtcA [Oscillospiraceae bacterium]|nr:tRNA 2-thiocytidine biosynthesis protein TtcA [Oscillospiraceae bacterium]
MQHLMGLVRRCADDYRMIAPNDKIAVGVSGGKDSLTLLYLLAAMREYYPQPYELTAITIDMGLEGMDFSPIGALCEELKVPFRIVKTEIGPIIFDYRKEKNPCSMCAKMRRGALNKALTDQGFSKVALGHHYDDAVETFLMSLLFEGRLSCFQPVTYLDRTGVTQIRPLLYLTEGMVRRFAQEQRLPVVHNVCPADKNTKREEIKLLIRQLSQTYPDLKDRIFGAMQRLPLPEWGVQPHRRGTNAAGE